MSCSLASLQLLCPKESRSLPTYIELAKPEMTVGRKRNCDVVLVDNDLLPKLISRIHAKLLMSAEVWKVVDNNSTNGVLVNSYKVAEQVLQHGDILHFGGGTGIGVGAIQPYLDNSKAISYRFQLPNHKYQVLLQTSTPCVLRVEPRFFECRTTTCRHQAKKEK